MAEWLLVLVLATSTGDIKAHTVANFNTVAECTDAMVTVGKEGPAIHEPQNVVVVCLEKGKEVTE